MSLTQIFLLALALVLLFFFCVILYAMWLNIFDNMARMGTQIHNLRRRKRK